MFHVTNIHRISRSEIRMQCRTETSPVLPREAVEFEFQNSSLWYESVKAAIWRRLWSWPRDQPSASTTAARAKGKSLLWYDLKASAPILGTKVNNMASRVKGLVCLWHHEHGRTYRSHDFSGGGRSRVLVSWRSTRDAINRRRVPWLATSYYLLSFPILRTLLRVSASSISSLHGRLFHTHITYYFFSTKPKNSSFWCLESLYEKITSIFPYRKKLLRTTKNNNWQRSGVNY